MQHQRDSTEKLSAEPVDGKKAKRRGRRGGRQKTKSKAQRDGTTGSSDVSSHSTAYQTAASRTSAPSTEKSSPTTTVSETAPLEAQAQAEFQVDVQGIMRLLPTAAQTALEAHKELSELLEVVMDLGRVPVARFSSGAVPLTDTKISSEHLKAAQKKVGAFGKENRAGIHGTLHRVSCLRNKAGKIIGLTCHVGHHIPSSARLVEDIIQQGKSILLLGPSGVGKTTALRCISHLLADVHKKRVVIVDTYNELAGGSDIPHDSIGSARRMQIPSASTQDAVMLEALQNHAPQVIVVDEIGSYEECEAARKISRRGVRLIAGVPGTTLSDVLEDRDLQNLLGGVQTSPPDGNAKHSRKGTKILRQRTGPPAFDVVVEILDRQRWRIIKNLSKAVDIALTGIHPASEIRTKAKGVAVGAPTTTKPAVKATQPQSKTPRESGPSVVVDTWGDERVPVNPLLADYDTLTPIRARSSGTSEDGEEDENKARFLAEIKRILNAKTHEDVLQVHGNLPAQEIRKRMDQKTRQIGRKVCPSESQSADATAARKRLNAACRHLVCRKNKLLLAILEATTPQSILQVKAGVTRAKLLRSYKQKEKALQAHASEPYVKEALQKLSRAYRVVKKSCTA